MQVYAVTVVFYFTMLLLLVVLLSAVSTVWGQAGYGYGYGEGDYAQCLTNHRAPTTSDKNARENQQRSRLEFSIALLKQIVKRNPSENVFMSPLGIYNALILAYFTSAGQTERSLRTALFLPPNQDKTDVLKAYTTHKLNLHIGRYKSQVHSANRLFISVEQTIKDCMGEVFFDEIEMVDFSPKGLPKTVDSINNWVSSHTNNKIQDLVAPDSISPSSQIVLANVAYFKGEWKHKFDPIDTIMDTFYISKNRTAQVPMMFQLNTFNHWRSDRIGAELLEMPYLGPTNDQSDISLILVLPDPSNSQYPAADVVMKLDYASVQDIVKESSDERNADKVDVRIPKFSLESTLEITPILEKMGVGDLFTPTSNLTGLTGGPRIRLNSAVHKAKVKVDEFGTEAAAATVFTDTRIPGESFTCDRPFIYLLYDKKEQSLLFAGVYNYPPK